MVAVAVGCCHKNVIMISPPTQQHIPSIPLETGMYGFNLNNVNYDFDIFSEGGSVGGAGAGAGKERCKTKWFHCSH